MPLSQHSLTRGYRRAAGLLPLPVVRSHSFVPNPPTHTPTHTYTHYPALIKTYRVKCLEDPEILVANVAKEGIPVSLVMRPKDLQRLLGNFQAQQTDITLLSHPPTPANAPLAPGQGPPALQRKRLRLSSSSDAARGTAGAANATDRGGPAAAAAALQTSIDVDTRDFAVYSHRGEEAAEATVNLKDLRVGALLQQRRIAEQSSRARATRVDCRYSPTGHRSDLFSDSILPGSGPLRSSGQSPGDGDLL